MELPYPGHLNQWKILGNYIKEITILQKELKKKKKRALQKEMEIKGELIHFLITLSIKEGRGSIHPRILRKVGLNHRKNKGHTTATQRLTRQINVCFLIDFILSNNICNIFAQKCDIFILYQT